MGRKIPKEGKSSPESMSSPSSFLLLCPGTHRTAPRDAEDDSSTGQPLCYRTCFGMGWENVPILWRFFSHLFHIYRLSSLCSDFDIVPLYALETFIDFSLKGLTSAVEPGLSKEGIQWCVQKYPLFNERR
ncbi:hypothetical protein TNCT_332101 [Trichonephila clavata]|uniref:Uncharacterized protein n=1 Tax=Trichonephila clavata TaxID=2740835 RepID=A0A8X6FNU6_TRICU|nr:hypothetical protein TNCT_332101 [Trichonephila clavata]